MARIHNLGFPRIGAERELKFAQEKHWRGALSQAELQALGAELRRQSWRRQAELDLVPIGDFAFYDHVLDASFLLGMTSAAQVNAVQDPQWRKNTWGVYGEDNWKLSRKLTVQLGLRWDLSGAGHELHYRNSMFAPTVPNPNAAGHSRARRRKAASRARSQVSRPCRRARSRRTSAFRGSLRRIYS